MQLQDHSRRSCESASQPQESRALSTELVPFPPYSTHPCSSGSPWAAKPKGTALCSLLATPQHRGWEAWARQPLLDSFNQLWIVYALKFVGVWSTIKIY